MGDEGAVCLFAQFHSVGILGGVAVRGCGVFHAMVPGEEVRNDISRAVDRSPDGEEAFHLGVAIGISLGVACSEHLVGQGPVVGVEVETPMFEVGGELVDGPYHGFKFREAGGVVGLMGLEGPAEVGDGAADSIRSVLEKDSAETLAVVAGAPEGGVDVKMEVHVLEDVAELGAAGQFVLDAIEGPEGVGSDGAAFIPVFVLEEAAEGFNLGRVVVDVPGHVVEEPEDRAELAAGGGGLQIRDRLRFVQRGAYAVSGYGRPKVFDFLGEED